MARGDWDGFFGLALDNLVQLLLIVALCGAALGFPLELLFGRILPGAAVSIGLGNLFYAWQARRLSRVSGREDVCALPYGINTVSLVAHVFLVLLPAKIAGLQLGLTEAEACERAWRVGLVATLGSGLIELIAAPVAERLRRATPRAALLATLAGIALSFIAMTFVLRAFARPVVGLVTLGIVLTTYFGGRRFRGGLPGGLVAVAVGTGLAWLTGLVTAAGLPADPPRFRPPVWCGGDLWAGLAGLGDGATLALVLSVTIPMGVFNVLGSLQNIESADAAGDRYPTAPSLAVNGLGSVAAALFGSPFPTTIYIGHPGWKAMGARAAYSAMNAAFIALVCITGVVAHVAAVVPIDAGMAIVVYIGIVIAAQAFQASPARHAPAVALGMIPAIVAWGVFVLKSGLGVAAPGADLAALVPAAEARSDLYLGGAFALSEGFVFCSTILAATLASVIDRRFLAAAAWCLVGSLLCGVGLMHGYRYAPGDTVMAIGSPAWEWAVAYALVGLTLWLTPRVTEPSE